MNISGPRRRGTRQKWRIQLRKWGSNQAGGGRCGPADGWATKKEAEDTIEEVEDVVMWKRRGN